MTEKNTPAPAFSSHTCTNRFCPWLLGTLGVMIAWMVYLYHGGEQSYVLIHECLDGNIPMCSLFTQSDVYFAGSDAVFQPLLGGVPRNCMPGETSLHLLPYRLLSAFHAFVLCEFLAKVAALVGMALLLRRHLIPTAPNIVICGVAFCFSLLPFFPCSGLTVAGQPLLLYAILNLRNRNLSIYNWLIVGLFPFLSSLVTIGFVLVPLLALCVLYEAVKRRKATVPLLIAWLLLTCGYVAAEYRLFVQVFAAKGFVSHRVEFSDIGQTLKGAVKEAILNFIHGQYHVESVQYPIIMLTCVVALAAWLFGRRRSRRTVDQTAAADECAARDSREIIALVVLCLLCGLISLFYGFYSWSATKQLIDATGISLLRTIQFQRVHWLHPFLWSLVFAFALAAIAKRFRFGVFLAVLLVISQAAMAGRAHNALNREQYHTCRENPKLRLNFGEFFSAPLFAEIRDYIGRPQSQYRVVSLGMYPSIALYNGFYTADGYVSNYSLDYKHQFRKVIAKELEKDAPLQKYYDTWGSRCYLFSHELNRQYLYTKKNPIRRVDHLDIDTIALRQLGVEYIFSAVEIGNSKQLGLKLEKVFKRDDSPWRIYVYAVPNKSVVKQKD
jgi:hypothetical protein